MQDDQNSAAVPSSSVNWPAGPPLPGAYPWPSPAPMSVVPPMGVRPPMMFGPPPAGFPPGRFMPPPRLPLSGGQDGVDEESQEMGADGELGRPEGTAEEHMHQGSDNMVDVPQIGNFPPPMGAADWRMRGPPPFMHGPNMLRPDMMRGLRPFLTEGRGPRGFPGVPPARFRMPQNVPNINNEGDEEYGEEYGEEEDGDYGEEEEGNEEEWNEEEANEDEDYNEECEDFDGNDLFVISLYHCPY